MFIGLFLLASLMLTIPLVEARTSQHLHRHVRHTADAPDAYILVADRVMSDDAVVYYLHPLVSSTDHPVTQPVSIVYDSKLSILVFNTTGPLTSDQSLASFAVNDNGNTPLIISETTPTMDFFTLNLNTFKTSSVGSIQGSLAEFISPNWFTYVKSLDQYWLVEMMNGPGPYNVLSLYADPIKDGKVTFSTQLAPIGEMGDQHITSDSANQLLYISIFVNNCTSPGHCDPPRGQLVTFDIKTQSVVHNASCTVPMRVRYSPSRKTLFATTLQENNSGYLQPSSIVEVDPATCKTRVLIDKLTPTAGEELLDAFNDVTGEWYFTWYTFWDQQILSSFYSINIDTKKITSPISFLYNTSEVAVAGITTVMETK